MSTNYVTFTEWSQALNHCEEVKQSLISKIGVPRTAVMLKTGELHTILISYADGMRTREVYEGMMGLQG